ncbi:MAG: nucleotide-diphospho-sugar transferase [Flavobacteriales bacterium]|nr:nucleotide-diphospho-sugar transferase [Flavobacteriales bacterium]MBK7556696.1 nucleotide-diphospho-sugar transferase [Flavobacteriales bacterium]
MSTFTPPGPLNTAVLFIAFKRFEESKAVMEGIRAAKPPRLYFACDGARNDKEREEVQRVRDLVKLVDWPCELKTRFSETNQTVKFGPPAAITWFFEHEEEGIILEDDCKPMLSWFWFAQDMLLRYRDDERIWIVMGNNLMPEWPARNNESYYYSAHGYGAYWGWASWRRMWRKYDLHMSDWPALRDGGLLNGHFLDKGEAREAMHLLESSWDGRIHSWDFQLDYGRIVHGGMNIIPTVNLIRNIGFGDGSTHTGSHLDPRNKDAAGEMTFPLKHPTFMVCDKERDLEYFQKYIEPSMLRRMKNKLKKALPKEIDQAITPVLGKLQRKLGIN